MSAFDAYYKWLGIPPEEQPPHHYRLLGIQAFESNPDVIESAGDRQMSHLRSFQSGQHAALSQKLLNEVTAAKLCLLNPERKSVYDETLYRRLNPPQATPLATAPSMAWQPDVAPTPVSHRHARPSSSTTARSRTTPDSGDERATLAAFRGAVAMLLLLGGLFVVAGVVGLAWKAFSSPSTATASSEQRSSSKSPGASATGNRSATLLFDWPKTERQNVLIVIGDESIPLPDKEPLRHACRPGTYRIVVKRLGFHDTVEKVTVVGDETMKVTVPLWRPKAYVNVQIARDDRPNTKVYLDGGRDAASPFFTDAQYQRFAVEPGLHQVRITNPRFRDVEQQVRGEEKGLELPYVPVPRDSDGVGLIGELYQGTDFQTKLATRISRELDFWPGDEPLDPSQPNDNFSARWTGWIKAAQPGAYRLGAYSDDGVRVYVEDKLVIDRWSTAQSDAAVGDVQLTGQPQAIRVDYYEGQGWAHFSLRWCAANRLQFQPLPAEALFHDESVARRSPGGSLLRAGETRPDGSRSGLQTVVYEGREFKSPLLRSTLPLFNWVAPRGNLCTRWAGLLTPPVPGKYRLEAIHAGGMRLWFNDRPVLDQWDVPGLHYPAEVELGSTPIAVRAEFFDRDAGRVTALRWMPPGATDFVPIPASAWSHRSVTEPVNEEFEPAPKLAQPNPTPVPRRPVPQPSVQSPQIATKPGIEPDRLAPSAPRRLAKPADKDAERTRGIVIERFEVNRAKSAAERVKVAEAMQERSRRDDVSPVEQYVLLSEAREQVKLALDVKRALDLTDALAEQFEIDRLDDKVKLLGSILYRTNQTSEALRPLLEKIAPVVDEAIEADRFDVPLERLANLVDVKKLTQKKDDEVKRQLTELRETVSRAKAQWDDFQAAKRTLETSPMDRPANRVAGQYHLQKQNWNEALPHLARGDDESLSGLAAQDTANPVQGQERLKIADGWYDLAKAKTGRERKAMQARATQWYREALPDLKGLDRDKAEQRLALLGGSRTTPSPDVASTSAGDDIELPLKKWVDVLPLLDSKKHVLRGDGIRYPNGDFFLSEGFAVIPVVLAGNYDIRCEFTRTSGHEIHISFPVGPRKCTLLLCGWKGTGSGLCLDGGWPEAGSPTRGPGQLDNNRRHLVELSVRTRGNAVDIGYTMDGQPWLRPWRGSVSQLCPPPFQMLSCSTLDLAMYGSIVFHRVEVRNAGESTTGHGLSMLPGYKRLTQKPVPEAVPWKGNWYWYSQTPRTFPEALMLAKSLGGRLLLVSSPEEHDVVVGNMRAMSIASVWTGAMRQGTGDRYVTEQFAPQTFFRWGRDQPQRRQWEFLTCVFDGESHDVEQGDKQSVCIEWGPEQQPSP